MDRRIRLRLEHDESHTPMTDNDRWPAMGGKDGVRSRAVYFSGQFGMA